MESIVETRLGKISGTHANGIHAFMGVPYGRPPSGRLRFLPSMEPEPWHGVLPATDYGSSSLQPDLDRVWASQKAVRDLWQASVRKLPGGLSHLARVETLTSRQGEDCLVLNVWTPGIDDANRPVMVWFHGGGWFTGSGSILGGGANLARSGDVAVVSVNHRLGPLGHLNLAEHGDEFANSVNVGLLDLVAALRWVRDNIASFGGDADNVTIFGESGGAEKVAAMLSLPDASGLFHRAIMQSGVGGNSLLSWEHTLRVASDFMHEAGAASVTGLLDMPIERLLAAYVNLSATALRSAGDSRAESVRRHFQEPLIMGPSLTGVLETDIARGLATGAAKADIPVLIGTVADETTLLVPADSMSLFQHGLHDDKVLKTGLTPMLGPHANDIVDSYRNRLPDATVEDLRIIITTDHGLRMPATRFAEHLADTCSAPVYMYLISGGTTVYDGTPRAIHALDIPMVFGNVAGNPILEKWKGADVLSTQLASAWTEFARTGTPKGSDLPHWTPYSRDSGSVMNFDLECRIVPHGGLSTHDVWSEVSDTQLGVSGER